MHVELAIFADKEGIEVSSIDIETGRIDRFGEGKYVRPRRPLTQTPNLTFVPISGPTRHPPLLRDPLRRRNALPRPGPTLAHRVPHHQVLRLGYLYT